MRLFELRGISKHFGAIQALSNVNLNVDAGEVLGLMGDNGAGKSTLIKIMAGNFRASSGEIWLKGAKVDFHNPVDARRKGVEVVYQDLALCDNLTAAENVFLGREAKIKFGPFSFVNFPAMYREAARHFAELKSETRPRDHLYRRGAIQPSRGRKDAFISRPLPHSSRLPVTDARHRAG